MIERFILKRNYNEDVTKVIYHWERSEYYKDTDYVLVKEDLKPITIYVPIECKDMGASWYEHKIINLCANTWENKI